jgi:hypothetical protein
MSTTYHVVRGGGPAPPPPPPPPPRPPPPHPPPHTHTHTVTLSHTATLPLLFLPTITTTCLSPLHRPDPNSNVAVWVGGVKVAQTYASPSPIETVRFNYTNGTVLEIRDEGANAVAEVDSLYFLDSCSMAPTAAPTAAPSGWWQVPNIPDINVMYSRLQSAESNLVALGSTVTNQASGISALSGAVGAIGVAVPSVATQLSTSVASVAAQMSTATQSVAVSVTTLSTQQSNLVAMLHAAVQNAVSGGGGSSSTAPQVSSSSTNDLVFTSGARVTVTSGSCSNADLCGAASFASELKQALANV